MSKQHSFEMEEAWEQPLQAGRAKTSTGMGNANRSAGTKIPVSGQEWMDERMDGINAL